MTEENPQDLANRIREQRDNLNRLNETLREAEQGLTAGREQAETAREELTKEDFDTAFNRLIKTIDALNQAQEAATRACTMPKRSAAAKEKEGAALELASQIEQALSEAARLRDEALRKRDALAELHPLIKDAEAQGDWELAVHYYQDARKIAPQAPDLKQGLEEAQSKLEVQKDTTPVKASRSPRVYRLLLYAVSIIGIALVGWWSWQITFVPPEFTATPGIMEKATAVKSPIAATFTPLPSPTTQRPVGPLTPTPSPTSRPPRPTPTLVKECGRLISATFPFREPVRGSRQYNRLESEYVFAIMDVLERNGESWIVLSWPGGVEERAYIPAAFVRVLAPAECVDLLP